MVTIGSMTAGNEPDPRLAGPRVRCAVILRCLRYLCHLDLELANCPGREEEARQVIVARRGWDHRVHWESAWTWKEGQARAGKAGWSYGEVSRINHERATAPIPG